MKLTPLDIRKQQFKKTMRGYDPVEVDTFLEMIAVDVEDALKQINEARDKTDDIQRQLHDYKQIEKTLQQTLLQAQEVSGKTFETARREANTIIREAESRSTALIENGHRELVRLTNEANEMRLRRDALIGRLRAMLSSELEFLTGFSASIEGKESSPPPPAAPPVEEPPHE